MTIIWKVFVALVADNLLGKYSQYYVSWENFVKRHSRRGREIKYKYSFLCITMGVYKRSDFDFFSSYGPTSSGPMNCQKDQKTQLDSYSASLVYIIIYIYMKMVLYISWYIFIHTKKPSEFESIWPCLLENNIVCFSVLRISKFSKKGEINRIKVWKYYVCPTHPQPLTLNWIWRKNLHLKFTAKLKRKTVMLWYLPFSNF